jgi:hypothetical protein
MVLLPRWALPNALLFSPVRLNDELPMREAPDMRVAEREPAKALLFMREPCILETARLGEIAELCALLDTDGADALMPDDPAAVPARAPPAGPACAQAKFEFPALRAALDPPAPPNECHWPSALAAGAAGPREADAPGPEFRAVEPARAFPPKRALDGGAAVLLPPPLFRPAPRFPEALPERLPENDLLLNAGIPDGRPA